MNFLRLFYFLLFIGIIIIVNSCGEKGGDENMDEVDFFTYDGAEFPINDAGIRDFGKIDLLEMGGDPVYTHYDYDFILTDGEISFVPGTFNYDVTNATFTLEGSLVSPDTISFRGGTFSNFNFSLTLDHDDLEGKYLFVCSILLDKNGNGDPYDDEDDEEFYVISGQISASGQPQEFMMEFDLALENSKTVKGRVTREFKYQDVGN